MPLESTCFLHLRGEDKVVKDIRRDGRVAEGAPLLREYGLTPIEGSNPSLSAIQSGIWRQSPREASNPLRIQRDAPLYAVFFLPIPELFPAN